MSGENCVPYHPCGCQKCLDKILREADLASELADDIDLSDEFSDADFLSDGPFTSDIEEELSDIGGEG